MKLLLKVLLLITEFFSIIKTGMGLKCFQNDNAEICFNRLEFLNETRKYKLESDLQTQRIEIISCLESSHESFSLIECDFTRKCNKLDVKLQDRPKMSFKFCDRDSSGKICEMAKIALGGSFENHLEHASCDYCDTDECNGDSKDFLCYETQVADSLDACAYELTHLLSIVHDKKTKKENLDTAKSDALDCWKRKASENLVLCNGDACSKLNLKLEDGTQVMRKFCDTKYYSKCESFRENLLSANLTAILSNNDTHCDICSESRCNGDNMKKVPEDASLRCWVTQLKYMCDYELMKWYRSRVGLQGDSDKLKNEALKCLKGYQREELIPCKTKNSVCAKLTLNFKDGDEAVFKFCDSKSLCQDFKKHLEDDFKAELVSAKCDCEDGCNSNQKEPSPPEVKQNKTSSRSSSSCIRLSVFALFIILGAIFI